MNQHGRSSQTTGDAGQPTRAARRRDDGRRGGYGRRAVLAGAAAAGAGAVAALAGRQGVALAQGTPVELGQPNNGGNATTVVSTAQATSFRGVVSGNGHTGVAGWDTSPGDVSNGVLGKSVNGTGVYATSANGTGVYASGPIGLQVNGRAMFSNSGVVMVPKGSRTVTVEGVEVNGSSIMLATIQKPQDGVYIEAAEAGVAGKFGKNFRITLNKAPTEDLPVGWFALVNPA
jgi:hypothetical protein